MTFFKKLYGRFSVPQKYRVEFNEKNTDYNNKATLFVSALLVTLLSAITVFGYIATSRGVSDVNEFRLIVPYYFIGITISVLSFSVLTVMRKKRLATHWVSDFISFIQMLIIAFLFQLSAHTEIATIGIKNINVIILMMLCYVFFLRFKLWVVFILETAVVTATIIMIVIEKDQISNFSPSIVNIICAGIIVYFAEFFYWDSRAESFKATKELEKLVTTDALTAISNRKGFDQRILQVWNDSLLSGAPLSLFFIDIDYFKKYNDNYGHIKGDKCLISTANVISLSVRKKDFVFRYGGEEFTVILPDAESAEAEKIALAMLDSIRACNIAHMDSVKPYVTFSIGCITCRPADSHMTMQEFINLADEALYTAKNRGRDRFFLHPDSLV